MADEVDDYEENRDEWDEDDVQRLFLVCRQLLVVVESVLQFYFDFAEEDCQQEADNAGHAIEDHDQYELIADIGQILKAIPTEYKIGPDITRLEAINRHKPNHRRQPNRHGHKIGLQPPIPLPLILQILIDEQHHHQSHQVAHLHQNVFSYHKEKIEQGACRLACHLGEHQEIVGVGEEEEELDEKHEAGVEVAGHLFVVGEDQQDCKQGK